MGESRVEHNKNNRWKGDTRSPVKVQKLGWYTIVMGTTLLSSEKYTSNTAIAATPVLGDDDNRSYKWLSRFLAYILITLYPK